MQTQNHPPIPALSCLIALPDRGDALLLSRCLRAIGAGSVKTADRLASLIEAIPRELPDLVIPGVLLPGLDVNEFPKTIAGMGLYKYPAILFACPSGVKDAPEMCIRTPASEESLAQAVNRAYPPQVLKAHVLRAHALLENMGIAGERALSYLSYAAAIAVRNGDSARRLSFEILPEISREFGVSQRSAADAMRRAIDKAWTTGDIEKQYAFFGNTIDETRGKPTVSALIAMTAEVIRLSRE